ncbi:MAG: zinc ribbon domain-containing protein, partial [Chitinophagales bacterium]
LKHIATKYGTVIQEVDRFYASSKTCSKCGKKKKDLSLKQKTYTCDKCRYSIDRDRNAAINIRQEAIRIYSQ